MDNLGRSIVDIIAGGGPNRLDQLQDVAISLPQNLQVLTYNSVTNKWQNQTPLLANDGDVSITSPQTGNILVYNGSTGKWQNFAPGLAPGLFSYFSTNPSAVAFPLTYSANFGTPTITQLSVLQIGNLITFTIGGTWSINGNVAAATMTVTMPNGYAPGNQSVVNGGSPSSLATCNTPVTSSQRIYLAFPLVTSGTPNTLQMQIYETAIYSGVATLTFNCTWSYTTSN
jgi:hypothetical protein